MAVFVVVTLVAPDKSAYMNELQGLQQFRIHWGEILIFQKHVHCDFAHRWKPSRQLTPQPNSD